MKKSVPPESNQATSRLSDGRSATEPGTEMMNDGYGVVKNGRWRWPETEAAPGIFPGAAVVSFAGGVASAVHPIHPDSRRGPRCTGKFR